MKSDTERKRFYTEKLHRKKNRLHVHISKDLRAKLKAKRRAILVHQGDTVRVMRGPGTGKEAKVGSVSVVKRKVYLEDLTVKNIRGKEVPIPVEASNLLLIALESTPERKELFSEEAFRKKEIKKEAKAEEKKDTAKDAGAKAEAGASHHEHQHDVPKHEHREHQHDASKHQQKPEHKPALE